MRNSKTSGLYWKTNQTVGKAIRFPGGGRKSLLTKEQEDEVFFDNQALREKRVRVSSRLLWQIWDERRKLKSLWNFYETS